MDRKRTRYRLETCVVLLSTISILYLLLTSHSEFIVHKESITARVFGTNEGAETTITDFYSCDAEGNPQNNFPKKSRAHFSVTVSNSAYDSKNVSLFLTVQDELDVPIGSDQLDSVISPNASVCVIMSIFIPEWAYVGTATAYVSLWVEGIFVGDESTRLYVGPRDLVQPVINLLSPRNLTYGTESVPLIFRVDERTSWVRYSLNNQENITLTGNTTLTGLENGPYNIIVYANDTSGNIGFSEKVYFTVMVLHDIAVVNLNLLSTDVYVAQIVDLTVIVKNEGTATENFNVTAYANATAIETQVVTDLIPNNQRTLVFEWNTTGFVKGNYTMSAYASPLPGEMDIADNDFVGGIVNVKLRPDIEVVGVRPSRTVVGEGYSISVNVTLRNLGDYTETFNITAYAGTTAIQTETITLAGSNNITITFLWNTTGIAPGSYTISAYAWPVPGETDVADNIFVGGIINVTIKGDVTGSSPGVSDGTVDVYDVIALGTWFGSNVPPAPANYDIIEDGIIDIYDVLIVASHFGETDL